MGPLSKDFPLEAMAYFRPVSSSFDQSGVAGTEKCWMAKAANVRIALVHRFNDPETRPSARAQKN